MKKVFQIFVFFSLLIWAVPEAKAITYKYYDIHAGSCVRNYTTAQPNWNVAFSIPGFPTPPYIPYLVNAVNKTGHIWCDVKLPDNATMVSLEILGGDGTTEADMTAYLYKGGYQSGSSIQIASVSSQGAYPAGQVTNSWYASLNEAIDHTNYSYWVRVHLPYVSNTWSFEIHRVTIRYWIP